MTPSAWFAVWVSLAAISVWVAIVTAVLSLAATNIEDRIMRITATVIALLLMVVFAASSQSLRTYDEQNSLNAAKLLVGAANALRAPTSPQVAHEELTYAVSQVNHASRVIQSVTPVTKYSFDSIGATLTHNTAKVCVTYDPVTTMWRYRPHACHH
jgi:hypothetical protein